MPSKTVACASLRRSPSLSIRTITAPKRNSNRIPGSNRAGVELCTVAVRLFGPDIKRQLAVRRSRKRDLRKNLQMARDAISSISKDLRGRGPLDPLPTDTPSACGSPYVVRRRVQAEQRAQARMSSPRMIPTVGLRREDRRLRYAIYPAPQRRSPESFSALRGLPEGRRLRLETD